MRERKTRNFLPNEFSFLHRWKRKIKKMILQESAFYGIWMFLLLPCIYTFCHSRRSDFICATVFRVLLLTFVLLLCTLFILARKSSCKRKYFSSSKVFFSFVKHRFISEWMLCTIFTVRTSFPCQRWKKREREMKKAVLLLCTDKIANLFKPFIDFYQWYVHTMGGWLFCA